MIVSNFDGMLYGAVGVALEHSPGVSVHLLHARAVDIAEQTGREVIDALGEEVKDNPHLRRAAGEMRDAITERLARVDADEIRSVVIDGDDFTYWPKLDSATLADSLTPASNYDSMTSAIFDVLYERGPSTWTTLLRSLEAAGVGTSDTVDIATSLHILRSSGLLHLRGGLAHPHMAELTMCLSGRDGVELDHPVDLVGPTDPPVDSVQAVRDVLEESTALAFDDVVAAVGHDRAVAGLAALGDTKHLSVDWDGRDALYFLTV